jgi:hypothetical protein
MLVQEHERAFPGQARGVGVVTDVGADREVEEVIGIRVQVKDARLRRPHESVVKEPGL